MFPTVKYEISFIINFVAMRTKSSFSGNIVVTTNFNSQKVRREKISAKSDSPFGHQGSHKVVKCENTIMALTPKPFL